MNVVLRLSAVSFVVLGLAVVGCTDSKRRQEVSASLDRIDVLIAKKEWEAARSEMRRVFPSVGSPSTDAYTRLNAQGQLLTALMIEESRAELERTHISVRDLFDIFDADEVQANRSYAGKEVRVKGDVGMFATDQFDRPYITLHSKETEFSVQAIFRKHDTRHEGVLELSETAFVTCQCEGKFGNVIILTRCSPKFPNANGMLPGAKDRETRKCGDGPRECA